MTAVENALVSVILPVYNAENQLRTCMESVLRQTYSNLEVIVVDDGSIDQSAAVARSFHDTRVTVIETEHRGVSHARNIGLENMKGQYFTFVDADDTIAKTYVETMLTDILQHSADIVFSRIEFHYQNESFDYGKAPNEKCGLANHNQVIESCFGLDENLRGYNAGVCGRLFRSDFYHEGNEHFHEEFSYGEDARWLFPLVMRATRIVLDEKVLYYYNRIRGKYTDYPANIRYYTWRLSFFIEHGLPKRMIASTENLLCSNQFSFLLQRYQEPACFKERIRLTRQFPKLWRWLITRKGHWSLGHMKTIGCYLMMQAGFPGNMVMRVWKLRKS